VSNAAARELFALVESFFVEYLPRQRGASRHTVRAYRDALKLLFEFAARRRDREIASLELSDLDAETIAGFLDHIEVNRSNSTATRNCRRAAVQKSEQTGTGFRSKAAGDFGGKRHLISLQSGTRFRRFRHP
jgi:hypothetical protein